MNFSLLISLGQKINNAYESISFYGRIIAYIAILWLWLFLYRAFCVAVPNLTFVQYVLGTLLVIFSHKLYDSLTMAAKAKVAEIRLNSGWVEVNEAEIDRKMAESEAVKLSNAAKTVRTTIRVAQIEIIQEYDGTNLIACETRKMMSATLAAASVSIAKLGVHDEEAMSQLGDFVKL
jgi:hypothetical protein